MKHWWTMAALAGAAISSAQLPFSAGFESSEGYALGSLATQQGWVVVGDGGLVGGEILATNPFSGTLAVQVDATKVTQNAWWYRPINFNTATSDEKLIKVSWAQRVHAPSGTPTTANSSVFGVVCYDPNGNLINGLLFDNLDARSYYFKNDLQDWDALPGPGQRDSYHQFTIWLNYESGVVRYERDGIPWSSTGRIETTNPTFGDADIHIAEARFDSAHFDSFQVQSFVPGLIAGTLDLEDFQGDLATRTVKIQLRNPSTGDPVGPEYSGALQSNGAFSVKVNERGTFDLAIRSTTHLSILQPGILVQDLGTTTGAVTLPFNGDANGDNNITTDDYLALSFAFDTGEGDPLWDPLADFNGDGFVTTDDYLILSQNFDLTGD